jgi:hypothetical protein
MIEARIGELALKEPTIDEALFEKTLLTTPSFSRFSFSFLPIPPLFCKNQKMMPTIYSRDHAKP